MTTPETGSLVARLMSDPSYVLRLHPALKIVHVPPDKVQIRGMDDNITIDDKSGMVRSLIEGCDGRTHVGQLLVAHSSAHEQQAFAELVTALEKRSVVMRATEPSHADLFANQIDLFTRRRAAARPQHQGAPTRTVVAVLGTGRVASAMRDILRDLVIADVVSQAELDHAAVTLAVVCSDEEDVEAVGRWNTVLLQRRIHALFVCTSEFSVRVGPYVVPHESGCYACFDRRRRSLARFPREFDAYLRESIATVSASSGEPRLAAGLAAHLGAVTATKVIGGCLDLVPPGSITEFNLLSGVCERSTALKYPRCEDCSQANLAPPTAIRARQSSTSDA